jgi:large subunit ribosomal protein L22
MKALLTNYRQSPRKVRLLADLVRGKQVDKAVHDLEFSHKRAAAPFVKLIKSAVANARHNSNIESAGLIVKEVQVNKGIVMKRMMPRAMGRGARINKRTSHLTVVLAEEAPKTKKGNKTKAGTTRRSKDAKTTGDSAALAPASTTTAPSATTN